MPEETAFDLTDFLPYLLNQAAEETGLGFSRIYRDRYGMRRTEWRVLAHLGRHGTMTAKEIGARARTHKTKISRAVRALQEKRFVLREEDRADRRSEKLRLSRAGWRAYADLAGCAQAYERGLAALVTPAEARLLRACLKRLAAIE